MAVFNSSQPDNPCPQSVGKRDLKPPVNAYFPVVDFRKIVPTIFGMLKLPHHARLAAQETSISLLQRCICAQESGSNFPTIWSLILKNHPLVAGLPTNSVRAGRITLEVPLITGQRLVCDGQVRKPLDILAWTASFEDCTLRPT